MSTAIDAYRFNEAAQGVYAFIWGTFCDWYPEFIKPILQVDYDVDAQVETQATAAWVLDQILHLLHPIMPYITEELWESISADRAMPLILAPWRTWMTD